MHCSPARELDFVHSETPNVGQKPFVSSLKLISSCPRNPLTLKNPRQQQDHVTMFQPPTPLLTGLGCLLWDLIASASKWTKPRSGSVKKCRRTLARARGSERCFCISSVLPSRDRQGA